MDCSGPKIDATTLYCNSDERLKFELDSGRLNFCELRVFTPFCLIFTQGKLLRPSAVARRMTGSSAMN